MDQGSGGIGAKPRRQNSQAQAKKHAQAKQKAESHQPTELSNEDIFRERFGPNTIRKDWSLVEGIVGDVLDQKRVVFARLMQATYNQGLRTTLQHQFSFLELVNHIKPTENENFALANLKVAFDHISDKGMLKKPIRESGERASSKGVRIKKKFHLCEDVDALFIREKLDKYPVGLIMEVTFDFIRIGEEIYYLPKKKIISPSTLLHSLVLIGHGVTTDGQLYFIGQNSWGIEWGCKGYVRIIIKEKCDIFCLKD